MKYLYIVLLLLATAKSNGQLTLQPIALPSIDFVTDVTAICQSQGNGCVLPVTLLTFTGSRLNNTQVGLNWTTTNEYNNKGFDVERSLGNAGSFYKTGFVAALADASLKKHYQFTDTNSYPGISYYRLKQLDLDENATFSNIISVTGYNSPETMSLSPNPANSYINVHIFSATDEESTIVLLGVEGRTIATKTIKLSKGTNDIQFQVTALPKGMYIIRQIKSSGNSFTAKFLKE